MKLVTEMDEIMAPGAMWKKYASPLPPLTGNGKLKSEETTGQWYRGGAHSLRNL